MTSTHGVFPKTEIINSSGANYIIALHVRDHEERYLGFESDRLLAWQGFDTGRCKERSTMSGT